MNDDIEPGDDIRDPLLDRAAAALRKHEHARPAGRAAVLAAMRQAPRRTHRGPGRAIASAASVAAAMVIAAGVTLMLRDRARNMARAAGTTLVEFSFDAPTARVVSVVGEFNGWNDRAAPMQRDARGTWITSVALEPGRHVYGFHVNGAALVPDPRAPVAPEELFGVRHSVVVVPTKTAY